ncbi:hypothetical protein RvVAR0630_43460 [Agrobacterium vitis]|nr:hypothetical protein RvVAR0630_43460 [Agrobacterium vitis]
MTLRELRLRNLLESGIGREPFEVCAVCTGNFGDFGSIRIGQNRTQGLFRFANRSDRNGQTDRHCHTPLLEAVAQGLQVHRPIAVSRIGEIAKAAIQRQMTCVGFQCQPTQVIGCQAKLCQAGIGEYIARIHAQTQCHQLARGIQIARRTVLALQPVQQVGNLLQQGRSCFGGKNENVRQIGTLAGRYRGLGRYRFDQGAGICTASTKRVDDGPSRPRPRADPLRQTERRAGKIDVGIGCRAVQGRDNKTMTHLQDRFDHSAASGSRFEMSDIRLDRTEIALPFA